MPAPHPSNLCCPCKGAEEEKKCAYKMSEKLSAVVFGGTGAVGKTMHSFPLGDPIVISCAAARSSS
jgi:hypothetical protein